MTQVGRINSHSSVQGWLTIGVEFANMLNEMRLGKITDATMKAFRRLDRPLETSGLDATEL